MGSVLSAALCSFGKALQDKAEALLLMACGLPYMSAEERKAYLQELKEEEEEEEEEDGDLLVDDFLDMRESGSCRCRFRTRALRQTLRTSYSANPIRWRWTPSGENSDASAYEVMEFIGAMPWSFPPERLWKAMTEPKCRFFAWLAIHNKVLTADNLAKRNWPHQPKCPLCYCIPETTSHILLQCDFTKAVWDRVVTSLNLQYPLDSLNLEGTMQCFEYVTSVGSNRAKNLQAGILFFFWWQIWKERNRRIFQNIEASFVQVASLVVDSIRLHSEGAQPGKQC